MIIMITQKRFRDLHLVYWTFPAGSKEPLFDPPLIKRMGAATMAPWGGLRVHL
jgi:hypothetical protein